MKSCQWTNKQTNRHWQKNYLLGRGNSVMVTDHRRKAQVVRELLVACVCPDLSLLISWNKASIQSSHTAANNSSMHMCHDSSDVTWIQTLQLHTVWHVYRSDPNVTKISAKDDKLFQWQSPHWQWIINALEIVTRELQIRRQRSNIVSVFSVELQTTTTKTA